MARVCVIGCGAIGGLFAAHLAAAGEVDVVGYDVDGAHVAAMNANGLRITGAADFVAPLQATDDPAVIGPCEYAIIATKSAHTEAAMAAVAPVLGDVAVCSVQNGLGNEEVIARHVPRVIRGATIPAGRMVEPGVVQMTAAGDTWIGPFEARPASMDAVRELAQWLNTAGLPTQALDDARPAQWTKVLFNASCNGTAALTGLTQDRQTGDPALRALISALVAEGIVVARAEGVALARADIEAVIDESHVTGAGHRPSTLQDVLAHRPTEIDALNGAIGRLGRAHDLATPLHDAIAALIGGVEKSWAQNPGAS